ncbi:DEAD/DEAH box helicase [Xanthomonadaceae bacterium JHOS43]|nr:DEAD/DEAH box helicase [Xanthomonadaceae bacterium JHOS43]MCX7563242.1 DEAD/DEAH box helicase [Xanthomonadaceae bacterium XH05]
MSFASLGLTPELVRALDEIGYTQPTPIQEQAIPLVLEGRDLLAGAQTGTGKTAAFSLPMLQRLAAGEIRRGPRAPRALVLTPTRELTLQVHDNVREYAKHVRLASTAIFGGAGMGPQIQALRRGVDILVATPGRLIDHAQQRNLDLSKIEILVLDEADRMLDMGFLPAIRRILAMLPTQGRQTLLFSATFAPEIKEIAQNFMRDPAQVQVTPGNSVVATIEHRAHPVDSGRKRDLLLHLLSADSRRQTLVFSRTKHGANRLAEFLEQSGVRSAAIHGNKSQTARMKALNGFKDGSVTVLVATDIAARGIDIDQLPMVVNFDLPTIAEDYVHRIGRTGRNGSTGEAISLVAPEEGPLLRDIQRMLKQDIALTSIAGFEASKALQMDGSLKAARRPGQAPTQRGQRPAGKPSGTPRQGAPASRAGQKPARSGNGHGGEHRGHSGAPQQRRRHAG